MTSVLRPDELRKEIDKLSPQVVQYDDSYYTVEIMLGETAWPEQIELIKQELPRTLAQEIGGQPKQFNLIFLEEHGYRRLTLRRRAPASLRRGPDDRRSFLEDLMNREIYELLERMIRPKYQGSVCGKVSIHRTKDGLIWLSLYRRYGRWRLCLDDVLEHFPMMQYAHTEHRELIWALPGDISNDEIYEFLETVAAYMELHMSTVVRVHDSRSEFTPSHFYHYSLRGHYREAIEFFEKYPDYGK